MKKHDPCWEEEISPYPSRGLVPGLIIKLTQDRVTREKERNLICVGGNLTEIGPKKCPKQAAFYTKKYICEKLTQKLRFWCLIGK